LTERKVQPSRIKHQVKLKSSRVQTSTKEEWEEKDVMLIRPQISISGIEVKTCDKKFPRKIKCTPGLNYRKNIPMWKAPEKENKKYVLK
jgi:hypothetical protein